MLARYIIVFGALMVLGGALGMLQSNVGVSRGLQVGLLSAMVVLGIRALVEKYRGW